jgi:hypothetical protein
MSTPLFDPNDPLVSNQDLIASASEVFSELIKRVFIEVPPAIVDTDPEKFDASFECL